MPKPMLKVIAFGVMTVVIIALAGPFPTLVTGILALVISGMILSHYGPIGDAMTAFTNALKG